MKKQVIVLGKGRLAVQIAEWFLRNPDYDLIQIVPVIPEPTWADSFMNWAKINNVSFVESGHYKDIIDVENKGWKIDLVFSVFYDKIIKEWFIVKCKRILNLHNSPLPRYRGVSPINWALKNNEKKHGVTIHEITPGIDDGPIIAQIEYSIYPYFDEVIDVYRRALEYGWILFQQTMPILEKIEPEPQIHSLGTYYSKNQKHLLEERRSFTIKESLKNPDKS